jgi:hypothetical protein
MKFKTLIFFIFSTQILIGQVNIYYGDFCNIVLYRSVDPCAEAMGKILSVSDQKYFTLLSNPALDNSNKEVSTYFSYSNPFYTYNKAEINSFGITYNKGSIGSVGFSMEIFELGFNMGDLNYPEDKLYSLSYANSISNIFNFGINANLITGDNYRYGEEKKSATIGFFDIGLSKNIKLSESKTVKDEINIGLHITNIFGKKANNNTYSPDYILKIPFPSILRIGLENRIFFFENGKKNYNFITLKSAIEYEDLLNFNTFNTIKFGAELTTLDLLSVRIGYYYRFEHYKYSRNYGFGSYNFEYDCDGGSFTFGAGLNIDFRRFLNDVPLSLIIDFVNMKQPLPLDKLGYVSIDNFHTVLARLRYHIN